jgi:hypothetical protein
MLRLISDTRGTQECSTIERNQYRSDRRRDEVAAAETQIRNYSRIADEESVSKCKKGVEPGLKLGRLLILA